MINSNLEGKFQREEISRERRQTKSRHNKFDGTSLRKKKFSGIEMGGVILGGGTSRFGSPTEFLKSPHCET